MRQICGFRNKPAVPLLASKIPMLPHWLEVIWEFSLSVWLLIRGFRPSPILTGQPVAIAG